MNKGFTKFQTQLRDDLGWIMFNQTNTHKKLEVVEWRQCHSHPLNGDAQRMLHFEADGSKWGNPEEVYKRCAKDLKDDEMWSLGQYPVLADQMRGEFKEVRHVLWQRGLLPGGTAAPEREEDVKDPWEQGFVAPYLPRIQKKLTRTGIITQADLEQVIGLDQNKELKDAIEEAVKSAAPVNHITLEPYDVDDPEHQMFIKSMLPTAKMTEYLPIGFELVQEAKTKSQSSSRNHTQSSDDFSPSSAQGKSTA